MNNNFVVPIPIDLSKIQSKLFGGLTKRQIIGFGTAILLSVPTFLIIFFGLGSSDLALLALFLIAAPIMFTMMYSKDGMYTEVWVKLYLEYHYLNFPIRRYKITKMNQGLAEMRNIKYAQKKKLVSSSSAASEQKKKKD